GQHHRQLRGTAARDDALIGDGLRRNVAEHRRHLATRRAAILDARDHRLEPAPGRRHQRQAVRQLGLGQGVLYALEACAFIDDRPAAPIAHGAMRTEATVVPPNDGMNAECLPGPPATVTWMSLDEGAMVNQSPSGLWPVLM